MPKYGKETDVIKVLSQLDDEILSGNDAKLKVIEENIKLFRGDQWKGGRPPHFLFNVIEEAIEQKIGKVSETRPRIRVMPAVNGLDPVAQLIQKTITSIWESRGIEYQMERVGYHGAIMGAAFGGTTWDPNLNLGKGDLDFSIRDPRSVGFDPAITAPENLDRAEYVRTQDILPLDVIRDMYPGRGALVKSDPRVSFFPESPSRTVTGMIKSAASRMVSGRASGMKESAIKRGVVQLYWIADRRKSVDDDGLVPCIEGVTRWADKGMPFPGGRRIIRSGDIILADEFNPYWDGKWDIDMLSWKVDPETAWAGDDIQPVKRLQEAVNRLGDAYTKNAILNSVVRIIVDNGALSPEESQKLSNLAAEIVYKNPGREFKYDVPPSLPAELITFITNLIGFIREKIGASEIPAQKKIPSIITGPAIEGLQLAIEVPVRTAARRIEGFLTRVGQKQISRIFQYYTSDRMLRIIGPTEEWMQFEFQRSRLLVDAKGKPRSQEDIRKAWQDFYFAVEPGSSLPITRVQRAMMKKELVDAGLLHPKEVLIELGIANPEEKFIEAQKAIQSGLFQQPGGNGKKGGGGSTGPGAFGGM